MARPILRQRTFWIAVVAGVVALVVGGAAVGFEQRLAARDIEPDVPIADWPGTPTYHRVRQEHDDRAMVGLLIWFAAAAAAVATGTCGAAAWAASPAGQPLKFFVVAFALALFAAWFVVHWQGYGRGHVMNGPEFRWIRHGWVEEAYDRQRLAVAAALVGNALGVTLSARRRGPHEQTR